MFELVVLGVKLADPDDPSGWDRAGRVFEVIRWAVQLLYAGLVWGVPALMRARWRRKQNAANTRPVLPVARMLGGMAPNRHADR